MVKKNEQNFEQKMKALKEIVSTLEKEGTEIDRAIELYQKGLKLSKELKEQLNGFEDKIKKISKDNK